MGKEGVLPGAFSSSPDLFDADDLIAGGLHRGLERGVCHRIISRDRGGLST